MFRFVPSAAVLAAFFIFVPGSVSAVDRTDVESGVGTNQAADSRPGALLIAQSTAAERRAVTQAVQERLTALGYDPGPVDGVAGPKTRDAISAYQAAAGLAPDGAISEELIARLNASLEPAARDEDGTPPASGDDAGTVGDGETTARATEDGAPPPEAETDDFVAAWMLGTWRIDCASSDPGLVFDRIAFDKTWSDDWTVSLSGSRISVCRETGGQFCYLYERLSESRMIFAGHQGATTRTPRNIPIEKCE